MGWSSTFVAHPLCLDIVTHRRADPLSNLKLSFDSKEEALAFCEKNGIWPLIEWS
jgi:hypothetical protein